MGFKAPGLGFLVVPGTFQALGHLFLGPKNTVPGRGNKKIKETSDLEMYGASYIKYMYVKSARPCLPE